MINCKSILASCIIYTWFSVRILYKREIPNFEINLKSTKWKHIHTEQRSVSERTTDVILGFVSLMKGSN